MKGRSKMVLSRVVSRGRIRSDAEVMPRVCREDFLAWRWNTHGEQVGREENLIPIGRDYAARESYLGCADGSNGNVD